jgi:hypothetical protein
MPLEAPPVASYDKRACPPSIPVAVAPASLWSRCSALYVYGLDL